MATEDDFEYWLADMDDALERFFPQLPEAVRSKLDYSSASLDVLESWFLERYPNMDAVLQKSESLTLDGVSRYVGETFRKQFGGHWEMRR